MQSSHPLPQTIVDNPEMPVDQMRAEIAKLEPTPPNVNLLTPQLRSLVEKGLDMGPSITELPDFTTDLKIQIRERTF
jgi:hypothetical protein